MIPIREMRNLQPWEEYPTELVSWLEVLQCSAYMFVHCGRALREVKSDCLIASIPNGDTPIFGLVRPIDELARNKAKESLITVETEFRKIGLAVTADLTKDVLDSLEDSEKRQLNYQWLIDQVTTLERVADRELNGKLFLYVSPETAKFWPTVKNQFPFGEEVARKFPSTNFDAGNSGVCIAVMMPTAAVFHLMRVLEAGLGVLAREFGVSSDHTNWQNILDQIESKIRGMSSDPKWKVQINWKEQQEFFSRAATGFIMFKNAWRNHVMHVRATYDESAAEQIFVTVRSFMQTLAERLQE